MNSYEEKQEVRRERYRELAAAARAESRERNRKAHSMAEAIPFGQPMGAASLRQRHLCFQGCNEGTGRQDRRWGKPVRRNGRGMKVMRE